MSRPPEWQAIAEELCAERCAQAGDPPCSRVSTDPHCDECEGMAKRALSFVAAEREACAKLCDEYAEVNSEICMDNILMDPILSGEGVTAENVAKSDECSVMSTIHSSQRHAGHHLAEAIRARGK